MWMMQFSASSPGGTLMTGHVFGIMWLVSPSTSTANCHFHRRRRAQARSALGLAHGSAGCPVVGGLGLSRPRDEAAAAPEGAGEPTRIEAMRVKIKAGGHTSPYRLRKQLHKPVFGQIKQARGFRQFLLRGFEKVRCPRPLEAGPQAQSNRSFADGRRSNIKGGTKAGSAQQNPTPTSATRPRRDNLDRLLVAMLCGLRSVLGPTPAGLPASIARQLLTDVSQERGALPDGRT